MTASAHDPIQVESARLHWRMPSRSETSLESFDGRILSILQQNCRISLNAIAHLTHHSKSDVSYRIRRMEEMGIITGYQAHLRLFSEFFVYRIIKLQQFDQSRAIDLLEKLRLRQDVVAAMSIWGSENSLIACAHADESEWKRFYKEICSNGTSAKTIAVIKDFDFMTVDYSKQFEQAARLFTHKDTSFLHAFAGKKKPPIKLNHDDISVLNGLATQARISLTQLAQQIGVSRSVVRKRVQQLIQTSTIIKFSANVNPNRLQGIRLVAWWTKARNQTDSHHLGEQIRRMDNGNGCTRLDGGQWDYVTFLHFDSKEQVTRFMEEAPSRFPKAHHHAFDLIHEQAKMKWRIPSVEQVTKSIKEMI
ncbi:MAG: Lrp/AsnC family transcriptional regulator [Candidatus Iainarchaeum archaeon]|uniref:Lrp/AsnC family transcriptional regulator n=1 Tax=Candidatus Iainarchaeum sp. TaxID=3101447 RepID=A0A7T9DKL0_9ARCH|nr:MAG: Lrp/AsnC family transcriptional regulator [Candidatus Diapherotrites archaeon]